MYFRFIVYAALTVVVKMSEDTSKPINPDKISGKKVCQRWRIDTPVRECDRES